MRNRFLISGLFLLWLFNPSQLFAQPTQTVSHYVPFASGQQNMWGPSWNAITIDQTITLFEESWNETFGTGNAGIVSIAGMDFGAAVNGHISGTVGMEFALTGFTTGTVEVDYPIDIDNVMNQDLSYDPGDNVSIETSYTVDPTAELSTIYPSAGQATLDFYFEMGFGLSATVCAFGCTTFPVIPSFNTGLINLNLFTIDQTGADFLTISAGPYASGPLYSIPGLPISTADFGSDPLGEVGLTATLDLPHVTTVDGISGQSLVACGGGEDPDSAYVQLVLAVFDLLGNIPGPVGTVLGNLDGSEDLLGGLATIEWDFFSMDVHLDIHNKQCFDFSPKVYGRYEFPVPVEYSTTDPTGALADSGTSSIINVEIGGDIDYKFPCYFTELDIEPTYSIDGIFTNHTYDSVALYLKFEALYFALTIPPIEITPEIYVPEICIPIPYPCPSWSCPWCWCTYTACTPAFTIPAIGYAGDTWSVGPLWEEIVPLYDFSYDWYYNTWSLEGFSEYTFSPFTMKAQPMTIAVNSQTNVSCNGGADGAIDVEITQTAWDPVTFTYSWTNGATTQDITGLSAGPHEVIVYDSHGCELFTGTTILEPTHPVSINYDKQDKLCNGGPDNGSIDITVQGGTAPYSYSWSHGPTSEDVNGLAVGSYTVTVTDANGCTEVSTIVISEPYVLGQSGMISNVDCFGDADGSIQVDVFGGVLPYTYSWSNGQSTQDLSGINASSYTLTVTDNNNCTSTATYVVTQPAAPLTLAATGVDVGCKGAATGSVDVTTTGGTPGYTYSWSNGSGILLPYVSEDISGLTANTYYLTATDANGCQEQISQVINQPAQSLFTSPVTVDILCFGDATGSIDPVIGGGTPAYSYAWSTGQTSPTLSNIPAGTYGLTVTDNNGCTDNYTYELTQPNAPLSLSLTGTDIACFGEATGSVQANVSGGTTPYNYNWSSGATSQNISNLLAGNYALTVTDANGCTISDNATLTEPLAPLALSTVVTDVDCHGNNTGSIDLSISGGTYPYAQQWSNSATIIMTDTTEDVSNQFADTYTVLVTDANGCAETVTSVITEPSAPLSITGVIDHVNCYALNDGAVDATVSGGTAPYSYSWSNGATTEDINAVLAGTYSLTVTDQNGCTQVASFLINEPAAALSVTTSVTDVDCFGDNSGRIESTVTGGTAPYTYLWSNSATTGDLVNLPSGTYTLTVTDAQGCTAFTGATVSEPAALVVTTSVTDASCFGYADGQIVLNVSGGVQPYYFDWGNQNNILLNNPSETLSELIAEDYFIRVRDENGCISEMTVTVGEPNPYVATYLVTDVDCYGNSNGAIDLTYSGGTSPYTTVWSDGQTTEDAVNLSAGVYTFIGTDAQACTVKDSVVIDQPDEIQISYTVEPVTCVDQTDAAIFVSPYGGTMPYTFNWSNGTTDQNIYDLAPGFYNLTIIDDNMCTQTFDFEIQINDVECLNIPNTITPNGDLYNDTWIIENIELYPEATVKIFNKWGNEIYSSQGEYTPWDGTHNGNPLPSEVYYYIIRLNNPDENEYTGTITIVR